VVVKTLPTDTSKIYFGAWVDLEDDLGEIHNYRIVGPDEVGDRPGYISMDAPLGRALLGRQTDDEISISTPTGRSHFYITDIRYTMPA
jgi:transcription elongation factor GreB